MDNGTKINQYTVIRLLGKGGMSEVYLAEDNLGRPYALKILSARLTEDASFRERFKREARIMASFNHPHIVGLHSYFEGGDSYCLAMEYLAGGSLKDLIKRSGPLPESQAMAIFRQIAQALAHAHSQGVIHRDMKPSNILIGADGSYKLGDFGIARMNETEGLTRTGSRMGTLIYMSPEQIRDSKHVDAKTDVYSLGVTLYEMLTGLAPYNDDEDSEYEIMDKIVRQDLPEPRTVYPHIGKDSLDLLKLSVCRDPDLRPTFHELLGGAASTPVPEPPGPIDPHSNEPLRHQPETMISPTSPKKKKATIAEWVWGLMIISVFVTVTVIMAGNPFVKKAENTEASEDNTAPIADVVNVSNNPTKEENPKTDDSIKKLEDSNNEGTRKLKMEIKKTADQKSSSVHWIDDFLIATSKAKSESKLIFWYWYLSDDPWSNQLTHEVINNQKFLDYITRRYILMRLDLSPLEHYERVGLAGSYNVYEFPAIIVIDPNIDDSAYGVVKRIIGYRKGGVQTYIGLLNGSIPSD